MRVKASNNGKPEGALRPEEFPLGSPESRAAARMVAANRKDRRRRIEFVSSVRIPWHGGDSDPDPENLANWPEGQPHFGPWRDFGETLFRDVYRPAVRLKPGEPIPSCSACGTPFQKEKDYPGMAYYAAACLDRHDPDRRSNTPPGESR